MKNFYICPFCNVDFKSTKNYYFHSLEDSFKRKAFLCPQCMFYMICKNENIIYYTSKVFFDKNYVLKSINSSIIKTSLFKEEDYYLNKTMTAIIEIKEFFYPNETKEFYYNLVKRLLKLSMFK